MYGTTTGLMGTQLKLEFLYELPYQVYFILYIFYKLSLISSTHQFLFFVLIAGKQTSPAVKTQRSLIVYLEDILQLRRLMA